MSTSLDLSLNGKLLIAMPALSDPRFARAVVLICVHSPEGSMGLIVNKPAPDLTFSDLLAKLGIAQTPDVPDIRVHVGGPVERGRGFVLHSTDYPPGPATMQIEGGFGMTATQDILTAMGQGAGPSSALLAMGYAGWGPGQLEAELARNDWLTVDAPADLVFDAPNEGKWSAALRHLGVDPLGLSSVSGRA